MIKSGLFVELANEFGVDLMYRDILYGYFSQFFELLPTYMGRGIRFIYTYATEDPSYPLATAATPQRLSGAVSGSGLLVLVDMDTL